MTEVENRGRGLAARARRVSAPQWYSLIVGAFLLVRGVTTLTGGADFGLPGDGWRSVGQLLAAAVLLSCLRCRPAARVAVLVVGLLYTVEAVIGNVDGQAILGTIPVDARDKIVHPTLALLALASLLLDRRGRSGRPLGR